MFTKQEKITQIKDFFKKTKLDPEVTKATIGESIDHINPALLKKAAHKLIQINRGDVEPDDRDNLMYAKFLGAENFFPEHVALDAGKIQAKAKSKMDHKKNLSWLDSGFFTPQLRSVVIGNSLAQAVDGGNPTEILHVSHKVTKMGEGSIGDESAIPQESRRIHDSHFGFIDILSLSEDNKIGVVNYFTTGTQKGDDNKLYRLVKDKDGKLCWKDHETLLKSKVEIPNF